MWADLRYRLAWFWRRRAVEADLVEELRDHLERETEKYLRAGLPRPEAARRAALAIGGIEQTREDVREAYGSRLLEDIWRDVTLAGRALLRQKRLTAALILTMSLGIGANTAIADVIDTILWRPMAVSNPDAVVVMWGIDRGTATYQAVSYPDFIQLAADIDAFDSLAGYLRTPLSVTVGDHVMRVPAETVTGGYFDVLAAAPLAGRVLRAEDQRQPEVAVISNRLWRRLSTAAPAGAIGQMIRLEDLPVVIVGVMPDRFGTAHDLTWGPAPDVWVPLSMAARMPGVAIDRVLRERETPLLAVLARLRHGADLSVVQAQLDAWSSTREPDVQSGVPPAFKVTPAARSKFWPAYQQTFVRKLAMLGTMATLVLMLSCVNITNFLLERSVRRRRELAVRGSLGADRWRLFRQLLIEGLVLAAPAFAASLLVARLLQSVLTMFPQALGMPLTVHLGFSWRAAFFCGVVSFLVAVGTSVFPALRATRGDVAASLRDDWGLPERWRSAWLGHTLVAAQVGITTVLLVVSLLMFRGVRAAYDASLGYGTSGIVSLAVGPRSTPNGPAPIPDAVLRPDAWGLSSVAGVALSSSRPLQYTWTRINIRAVGSATVVPHIAMEQHVSGGFFSTLQIPLLSGASFDASDAPAGHAVIVVNATLATRLWGTEPAVGRALEILRPATTPVRVQVIGVVPDIRWRTIDEAPIPYVYRPLSGASPAARHVIVQTAGFAGAPVPDLLREWTRLAPNVPIARASTMVDLIDGAIASERVAVMFVSTFAALAVVVATIGISSAMAWAVERRSREIAVRIAIGGSPASVGGRVVGRAIAIAGMGAVVGLAAGVAMAPHVLVLNRGVRAADPASLAAAVLVFVLAAIVAAAAPAWRAAAINPLPILKGE